LSTHDGRGDAGRWPDEGDAGAAAQDTAAIYRDSFAELVRYLTRLTGNAAAAEDLAQEAGVRLLRAARTETIREPRAWLFHAGANLARDALRRRVTADAATQALRQADDAFNVTPDEQVSVEQELSALTRAIEALPPQARRIVILARVDGLSHKEIARELGIAPKTVENHLGRAVAALARALGRRRDGH
jgi:RNA polymerase sigma-70 factor (ECF subfamily)